MTVRTRSERIVATRLTKERQVRWTGRIALVTGANKGIGFEISRQLGKQASRSPLQAAMTRRVAEAAARLCGEGLDAHGIVLDVTDPASAEAAARWLDERFGRLDVLVNNAGVGHEFAGARGRLNSTLETLRATYETNVFGAFSVIQPMLPLLKKSASPRIINQSSTLGSLGIPERPAIALLRHQPPRLQLVQVRPERPDAGVRQGSRRGPDLGQLGLPRLGQDRHGDRRRPPHGRAGSGHRRETGDDGRTRRPASSSTTPARSPGRRCEDWGGWEKASPTEEPIDWDELKLNRACRNRLGWHTGQKYVVRPIRPAIRVFWMGWRSRGRAGRRGRTWR